MSDKHVAAVFFLRLKTDISNVCPADAVTLHLSSMPSGYLSSASDRIRQVSVVACDVCAHMQPVFETLFPYCHLLERLNLPSVI